MDYRNFIAGIFCAVLLLLTACAETSTDRSTGQAIDDGVIEAKAKTALIENADTSRYIRASCN